MSATIGLWNANGLQATAIDDVLQHCTTFDLLFITETWLLSPTRIPTTWQQHHLYGTPVRGSYRGANGVTALISPSSPFTFTPISIPNRFSLGVIMGDTTIICLYIPPSLPIAEVQPIFDSIPFSNNTIICGDLNARLGPLTGDRLTNTRGTLLRNWLTHRNLTVWNASLAAGIPTYRSFRHNQSLTSIVDLFISDCQLTDPSITVCSDLSLGSDHTLLCLSFRPTTAALTSSPPPPQRRLWNLSRLDEEGPRELYIASFNSKAEPLLAHLQAIMESPPPESPNIDEMADQLNDNVYHALTLALGTRTPRPHHWKWFWTPDLQSKAKYRDHCFRRWRRAHGIERPDLWELYQTAHHSFRSAIKAARRQAWRSYCNAMERDFAKATTTIKTLRRKRQPSHTFTHPNGPTAAADEMARHLATVCDGHLLPSPRPPRQTHHPNPAPLTTCPFDADTVEAAIRKLPNRKAPGPDHVRAEMLKPLLSQISPILNVLFKICWQWTYVPKLWRQAQVCPIFKKGDPNLASNYRPISLTSIFRKIMEVCLAPLVSLHSPTIDIAQGGFRPRCSALDQALCLHELMSLYCLQHRRWPVVAFLDIKAAYDTVDRRVIWDALATTNTPPPLLALLSHMFDDVSICVLLANHLSSEVTLATGVLQGSVLSPQLYSIYINSLPETLRLAAQPLTPRVGPELTPVNSLLFADDVALIGSTAEVQQMLGLADTHSRALGYQWSPTKCTILNAPEDTAFTLYDTVIPNVDEFAYLGLPFRYDGLSTRAMLQHRKGGTLLAASTLRAIGARRTGFSLLFTSKLYKLFVRPKFEYGLAISRFNSEETRILERLQDKCLRLFFGGHPTSSTAVYKHICDVPHMEERLDILRTKFCLRFATLPLDCLIRQLAPLLTASRINYLRNTPLFRSIPTPFLLNKLPDLITSRRLSEFRKRCSATPLPVLLRACRPMIGIDPILTVPATRTERSRLTRWRMGWLPGKPKPCPCDPELQHTSRNHIPICPYIPSELWEQLPPAPVDTNPIDHAISSLPDHKSACPTFWLALLTILRTVDQICLPDVIFPDEPDLGALWLARSQPPEPP